MSNKPATDNMTVCVEAMLCQVTIQLAAVLHHQVERESIIGPTEYTVHFNMKLDIEFMISNITGSHRSFNKLTEETFRVRLTEALSWSHSSSCSQPPGIII